MSKPTYYAGDVISQIDDWHDYNSDNAEWPRTEFIFGMIWYGWYIEEFIFVFAKIKVEYKANVRERF